MSGRSSNLVVYTALMGKEFTLPPVQEFPGVDFVCFSDRTIDNPGFWDIRLVEPLLAADLPKSSREYKIRPHIWLSNYDRSLYIDSKVQLLGDPLEFWHNLLPKDSQAILGLFKHSFRDTLRDEFAVVLKNKLDEERVVERQLKDYEKFFENYLNLKPLWGGILARKHNQPDCIKAMDDWYANVLHYSRRDQLSLPISLRHLRHDQVLYRETSNHKSNFHVWPVGSVKKPDNYFSHLKNVTELERDAALAERDAALAERDRVVNSRIWRLLRSFRFFWRFLSRNFIVRILKKTRFGRILISRIAH